jgi:N,N'-diacetyllegionaminate synthase
VKIASTDLTNHQLIYEACAAFEDVIISTGMATIAEIETSLTAIRARNLTARIRLMHCVSAYPCPLEHANTQRIRLLADIFGIEVGYSDHTEGNEAAVMALAHGAAFFEKHFTSDRTQAGFDHAHALEADGLTRYIQTLRAASDSLSRPANQLSDLELVTKTRARRGVYASRALKAGHVLAAEDLLYVRPSTESALNGVDVLIGKVLEADCAQYEALGGATTVLPVGSNWQSAKSYWIREMRDKKMLEDDKTAI